jgi:hypothetical protein
MGEACFSEDQLVGESTRVAEIRRRMAQIRSDLDEDVEQIVENAKVMADWRHYWRSYPWACLGLAAAVGYLIVPSKLHLIRPDVETLLQLARKNHLVVDPKPKPTPRAGLSGAVIGWLARTAVRGAIGYVTASVTRAAARHADHECRESASGANDRR